MKITVLFVLSRSPYCCDLTSLINIAHNKDVLLLIADGVIGGLIDSSILLKLINSPFKIYALKNDIEARGLSNFISCKISVVDYIYFVKLTENHIQQVLW